MQTFNRKKLNDYVAFPLYLNMNPFLDKEKINDSSWIDTLVKENPLNKIA